MDPPSASFDEAVMLPEMARVDKETKEIGVQFNCS